MKMILVDDELWTMEQFELEAAHIPDIEIVGKFNRATDALTFAESHEIDFALLDIEMPQLNGIALGRKLKEINPGIILIYVSGYDKYLQEAMFDIKADYYILKPYNHEDVENVLERAKLLSLRQNKRIFVHTFGRFDVYIDDRLIHFSNAKAKELFALCIDHAGGTVSMEEAVDKLWEDREYDKNVKSLYRKAVIYLNTLFREYQLQEVFISSRGCSHIQKTEISCDYFDFLEGKNKEKFTGEYMFDYSWAEQTTARLLGI